MARRKESVPPEPQPPQVPPLQGLELLKKLISKAEGLLQKRPLSDNTHSEWELLAENYLEKAFGKHSPNIYGVLDSGKFRSIPGHADETFFEQHRSEILNAQKGKLETLLELLQTEHQLSIGVPPNARETPQGHKIFLVHGHDEQALHETARFLEKLRQDVIILREQPNQGRTIIEKFEAYSDVGFAIVLLTADDTGASKGGEPRPRARQNVVFELGYFIGRLGRDRVCALYSGDVEIPSDYSGILYTKLDPSGIWRLEVAKELKAAGFAIDMNLAL